MDVTRGPVSDAGAGADDGGMTVTALPEAALRESGQFAVDLEAVVKRFGAVTAVDGISLQIRPGEVVALLGPNGAGKTSTVDMLLGLSAPTRGAVQGLRARRRRRRWRWGWCRR